MILSYIFLLIIDFLFIFSMCFIMYQKLVLSKVLLANRACEIRFGFMCVNVFLMVRNLVKFHSTAIYWAYERLFVSMNSEMIKKIVPFPEKLATPFVITRKYIRSSIRVRASKFNLCKFSGLRNVDLILKGT